MCLGAFPIPGAGADTLTPMTTRNQAAKAADEKAAAEKAEAEKAAAEQAEAEKATAGQAAADQVNAADDSTDDPDPSDEDTREWVSTLTRDELTDMQATYTALLAAVTQELAVRPVDSGAEWS